MNIFKLITPLFLFFPALTGQEKPVASEAPLTIEDLHPIDSPFTEDDRNDTPVKKSAPTPITLDRSFPTPNYLSVLRSRKTPFPEAEQLLKQGKLGEFYQFIEKERKNIYDQFLEEVTEVSFEKMLWILYYNTSAPLFKIDDEGNEWNFTYGDIDLDSKFSATFDFFLLYPDRIAKKGKGIPVRRKELSDLLSTYYACIMRTLRDNYDPDIYTKINKMSEEGNKIKSRSKWIDFQNKKAIMGGRSAYALGVFELRENRFVETIVELNSGKAADVKKYLKQTGYTDKEIPGLIDRTVGRDSKTEFLYKTRKEKKAPKK